MSAPDRSGQTFVGVMTVVVVTGPPFATKWGWHHPLLVLRDGERRVVAVERCEDTVAEWDRPDKHGLRRLC